MNLPRIFEYQAWRYLFALIWLVNGLWCKALGMVPRHQEIVGVILGTEVAAPMTMLIGLSEIGMALWIVTGLRYRSCATLQIIIILVMNVIEFITVPHLLLWGHWNLLFAIFLCMLIYLNAYRPFREAHA